MMDMMDGYCFNTSEFPDTSIRLPDPTDDEIRERANTLWIERGCPIGSPDNDWAKARRQLFRERDYREWDMNNAGDWNARPPPFMWMPGNPNN